MQKAGNGNTEKTDASRALGPAKWTAGENRVTLLLDTNCKWSKDADRCSVILGELRTQAEQAIPRAEQQEVIWRIPGANRASFLPISHRIHGIQLRTTFIVAAESMDFWLNFGIIWFENHGMRPGGGAAEFRGHGFPECQNRIAHASLLTRISAQAKRSSRPKAQLCRSAGRELLRSAIPCAPPRMEVLRFILERVCDGENREIKALGRIQSLLYTSAAFLPPLFPYSI